MNDALTIRKSTLNFEEIRELEKSLIGSLVSECTQFALNIL